MYDPMNILTNVQSELIAKKALPSTLPTPSNANWNPLFFFHNTNEKNNDAVMDELAAEEENLAIESEILETKYTTLSDKKAKLLAELNEEASISSRIAALKTEIAAIDVLISSIPQAEELGNEILFYADVEAEEREVDRNGRELLLLARRRMEIKSNYVRLGSILFFFVMYSTTILLQQDAAASFEIESR